MGRVVLQSISLCHGRVEIKESRVLLYEILREEKWEKGEGRRACDIKDTSCEWEQNVRKGGGGHKRSVVPCVSTSLATMQLGAAHASPASCVRRAAQDSSSTQATTQEISHFFSHFP